jgi:hypothetical protein
MAKNWLMRMRGLSDREIEQISACLIMLHWAAFSLALLVAHFILPLLDAAREHAGGGPWG